MYVCMYVCMHVCMYERMYVCMYVVQCHVPCNWLNASSPSPSIPAVSNKIQWPASGVAVVLLLLGWVALSLGTPPSIPSSTSQEMQHVHSMFGTGMKQQWLCELYVFSVFCWPPAILCEKQLRKLRACDGKQKDFQFLRWKLRLF